MKILYISPRYYPHVGGVEYVVKSLATRFAKLTHQIMVLAGEPGVNKPVREESNGVQVIRWPTIAPNNAYHIPTRIREFKEILKQLAKTHDVIHIHSVHGVISGLPLIFKSIGELDSKLVYTMHFSTEGYTTFRKVIWKLIWKNYLTLNLRSIDLIHATSPLEARQIIKHFPNIKNKIAIVPIGLEEDVFQYTWKGKDSDYILYAGRLEKYKHVDLIIDALAHIARAGYKIKLVVVGSGSYKNKIINKAKRVFRETHNYFVYYPPRSRKEYLELLSGARAVINLSEAENFNIFLAEAYAIGVPIIATQGAAAFCPKLANVRFLDPVHIAEVIFKILYVQRSHTPYKCLLKTWLEAAKDLERFYEKLYEG